MPSTSRIPAARAIESTRSALAGSLTPAPTADSDLFDPKLPSQLMQTGSPPVSRIITMVLFALSCVGLLLFLWLSFGGTIPFNPQGYRFKVSFPNALDLADQADVRIAGVTVGKVDRQAARSAAATARWRRSRCNNQYAPIRQDTQAILRDQDDARRDLRAADRRAARSPPIPDGGTLSARAGASRRCSSTRSSTRSTRRRAHAFQVWQQQLAKAVSGNDQNLNDVLGNLPTFAANVDRPAPGARRRAQRGRVSSCRTAARCSARSAANQAALRNLITSRRDDVRHHRRQQQRARRDVPRVPDVPEREPG